MTYGSAAAPVSVWIALSESGGVYAEAADALRNDVDRAHPGRVEWRVAVAGQIGRPRGEPQWVVAVGTAAQRAMQELFADDPSPPPLLAILVPKIAFERFADPQRLRSGQQSAIFLDQPPSRQIDLAQLAIPSLRSLGILYGSESKPGVAGLERAARERGVRFHARQPPHDGLFGALQLLLPDIDVLLAVPDPQVFNGQTAANILAAAYRRRVPLIGFSPAYARAGALVSLYSTPAQVGRRGGEVLRQAWAGRSLPPPQSAREFVVTVNQDVARSLDLVLSEEQLTEQLRLRERQ
jgi:hypothetical protein